MPKPISDYILHKKVFDYSGELIIQGQKEGSIREGDPIALAIAFFMAIQGIAENIGILIC